MSNWRGLSLFSGIGGLDLAFERAGGHISAFCEIEPYCRKVLRKYWPDVPIFNDVKELKGEDVGTVDVVYGGFPCQPFSVAGDQKGTDDTRYLWPEFSRLVGEIRPRWVVAENVPGILHIAADTVCADLERQGYSVGIFDYEAAAVGAKHRRERIFFVAHARRALLQRLIDPRDLRTQTAGGKAVIAEFSGSVPDREQCATESRMGRGLDGLSSGLDGDIAPTARGVPNRTARLRALGNAVVPQQAYILFKAIIEADEELQQEVHCPAKEI